MTDQKDLLRKRIRCQLALLSREDLDKLSRGINSTLIGLETLRRASCIGLYWGIQKEIDISLLADYLLTAGKAVAYPRYSEAKDCYDMVVVKDLTKDFVQGKFGIQEPAPSLPALPNEALKTMTWLVPGLAFDRQGNRLGRGGGFYDRLLLLSESDKIGVALEQQVIDHVPMDEHDIRVNQVVTDQMVYGCYCACM